MEIMAKYHHINPKDTTKYLCGRKVKKSNDESNDSCIPCMLKLNDKDYHEAFFRGFKPK